MNQMRAYRKFQAAIRNGVLTRPPACSKCGALDTKPRTGRHSIQGHHHKGYDHPLDVEWLCPACHRLVTPLPFGGGGVSFGEHNGASRLTAEKVAAIRASPVGCVRLGRHYGVDKKTIQRVRRGETWASAAPSLEPGT